MSSGLVTTRVEVQHAGSPLALFLSTNPAYLQTDIDLTGVHYQHIYAGHTFYDKHRQPLSMEECYLSRMLRGEVCSSEQAVDMIMRLPSGREVQLAVSGAPVYDRRGLMIGSVCVFRDVTEARQKERRVQQALNDLLTIVEEVSRLPIQADEFTDAVPIPSLHTVGRHLTEIIRQVLQCCYATCISIEPQTGQLSLVGVSGLTAQEEYVYWKEVEQSCILDYLEVGETARLRANEVVIRDLVTRPYVQPRTDFGIRYRLLAPMLLDEQLVGLLIIAQSGADVIYTPEDIALMKAIAKLVLQVIERARLTNEWMAARANELALHEANRCLDSFLSIASHELHTPLTTIKGSVQLALRRMEKLKSQFIPALVGPDYYEQIMQSMERIHQLLLCAERRTCVQERMIGDLLDASRIRANKLELLMQPCNLVEIVCEMVEDLHYVAPDRVVRLHLPETGPVPIVADADRIGQVINNYLVNALRYSPTEQPVDIWLEVIEEGTKARVAVRDQGSGIAPQDLEYIWERFSRGRSTAVQYNTGAGLGLGLSICRSIIEGHKGQFGAESVQGKGSTFWFMLALALSKETS